MRAHTWRFAALLVPFLPLVAAATALWLPAPALASGVHVPHRQGVAELEAVPQRIAVFDLSSLDILDALGVEVLAVPDARFPDYLAAYGDARYHKVGTLFEPDLEALRALQPDLIIVGGRSRETLEVVGAIAPAIDTTPRYDGFTGDVVATTLTFGRVFGRQAEANALVARLLATRGRLAAHPGLPRRSLTLFAVGGGANAPAPGERFGIVHDLLLAPSVLPARPHTDDPPRPPQGSPEAAQRREQAASRLQQALAQDPQWLFVLDRPSATGGAFEAPEVLAAHPLVSQSGAWREGRVLYLDAPTWYLVSGGITALQATLEQAIAALDAADTPG